MIQEKQNGIVIIAATGTGILKIKREAEMSSLELQIINSASSESSERGSRLPLI